MFLNSDAIIMQAMTPAIHTLLRVFFCLLALSKLWALGAVESLHPPHPSIYYPNSTTHSPSFRVADFIALIVQFEASDPTHGKYFA